jgi:putative heme-binding domain-containing protein
MFRRVLLAVCALGSLFGLAAAHFAWAQPPLVAPSEALSPHEQQKLFHLPPGFEIQLFASEPAISKPMNLSFDSAGRLFLTDTLEYPYPAAPGSVPRDTVKILVDRNLDGAADEITTFVDGLNIPLGVMPIPRGVLVYGIPAVMRCLDTDGDGKADTRQPVYTNFGHRDTHGMVNSFTRGLDGWLYACHGFANDSAPQGSDGQAIAMNSGNTFRMRLDGSRVEYVTHGQVNPFGLAFDPLGNLYSADCHSMPIYMLLRGAYYPSFGKAHDGLGFGPTMIGHDHGSTGIGGIAYYAAEQFPPEYRDTILIGNPVTGRVNHDRLKSHGSTYEAIELPDFITCDDPWFRPVNLQVGPDGALYVADFYNRIIGHYEVPLEHPGRDRTRGRIWRVVYTGKGVETGVDKPAGTAPPIGPDISQAPLRRLLDLLGDPNLAIRAAATHELVDRVGPSAVEPLRALLASPNSTAWQRLHGMWALEQLGGLEPATIDTLARASDRAVRVHVMKLLAERAWDDSPLLRAAISDPDPFVRRAAADALGRHPRIQNVKPLLALWASTPADDTHLVHVARMALRNQLLKSGLYAELSPVVGDDRDSLDRLANVSLGVPNADSAAFVWQQLRGQPAGPERETYLHHVARHIAAETLGEVYAVVSGWKDLSVPQQSSVIRALGRAAEERGEALPADVTAWATRLADECLAAGDEARVRSGIELARDLRLAVFDKLARAARWDARFDGLRVAAIDACVANDAARSIPLLTGILGNAGEPMALRQHSAAALARINDDRSRGQLVKQLQAAPERLSIEIAAALADSPQGAESLLAAVESGKASPRLLQENNVARRLSIRRIDGLVDRMARLTAGLPPPDARLRELIDARRGLVSAGKPDLVLGAAVFEKHCANCHRIGQRGAKIGPNLDGVGIRGVDRLLEDILDPSRNVDQAFRTTQIVSTDGRIVSGLALREEGEVLVLADAQGKEVRVPKDQIDQRAVSPLSVMPSNVPDLVSEADFVHLVGYLLAQRVPEAPK